MARGWAAVAGRAVAVVLAGFAAMFVVALAGLRLAGAGTGSARMAVAIVALAVGGSVRLSTAAGGLVTMQGRIVGVPLGVALAGALAVAAVRLVPAPLTGRRRSVPAAGLAVAGFLLVLGGFLLALGGLAGVGQGTVRLALPQGGAMNLGYRVDAGRTLAGGAVWVAAVLAATAPALWRRAADGSTGRLPGGFAGTVSGQLAGTGSGRLAGMVSGGPWAMVRAVVRAGLVVLAGLGVASMLAGAVAVPFVHNGQTVAGLALLAGPNVAVAALTLGLRVPWSAGLAQAPVRSGGSGAPGLPGILGGLGGRGPSGGGPPGAGLPGAGLPGAGLPGGGLPGAGVRGFLPGRLESGAGRDLSAAHLAGSHPWVASLAVAAVLVLMAALALGWRPATPARDAGTGRIGIGGAGTGGTGDAGVKDAGTGRVAVEALRFGAWFAGVLAVAVPLLALATEASGELTVSLFGFALADLGVRASADWWVGVPAGAVAGLLAGTAVGFAAGLARRTLGTRRGRPTARILEDAQPSRSD